MTPIGFLPKGWQWSDAWTIDLSGAYGGCDDEGWSYASSFEFLFESCIKKTMVGEMGRLSLVRRRRWTRTRGCITADAKADHQAKLVWIHSLLQRLKSVMSGKETDSAIIFQYESKRKTAFESVLGLADQGLAETCQMLEGVCGKLAQMKSFLIERGTIEREYSKRLESLASRWLYAGQPANYSPPADHSPPPNPGFFFVVSSANHSVAQRLADFSSMLSGSLPLG